jgi:hypothetical protein
MARPDARAPKGERASAAAPVNKGKNVPVLGALSLPGLVEARTIDGRAEGQVVATFMQDVLVPALRPGQSGLMENLSAHKVAGIQEAMEAKGARRA